MKEHSYSCEYPEGCSCGASEFNDLAVRARNLESVLRFVVENPDTWHLGSGYSWVKYVLKHGN